MKIRYSIRFWSDFRSERAEVGNESRTCGSRPAPPMRPLTTLTYVELQEAKPLTHVSADESAGRVANGLHPFDELG